MPSRLLAGIGAAVLALVPAPASAQRGGMATAKTPASVVLPIAVFGKDTRQRLPKSLRALKRSIGLVYSNRARSVCTGFCVADNVIATASHCLFRTAGERRPSLRTFRFILRAADGQPTSPIAGSLTGNGDQFVIAGSRRLRIKPPIDATKDWALVRLDKALCRGANLPIASPATLDRATLAGKLELHQISFHHDYRNWRLAYSDRCSSMPPGKMMTRERISQDFTSPGPLLLHSCDTGGASSGSPILAVEAGNRMAVVGINVGTYIQTRMLVEGGKVVRRFKAHAVANTAVNAATFKMLLQQFSGADILSRPRDIRDLQSELKTRGFYHGRIDGAFGPATRQAIQALRGIPGLDIAGLPTRSLLTSLRQSTAGAKPIGHRHAGEASRNRQRLTRGRLRRKINPARRP